MLEMQARTLSLNHSASGDAVLDLVGNSVLLDSLAAVRRDGCVCLAGFLSGLAPLSSFNPLLQMPSGVHFSFFDSFVFGTREFPLSDVPLQAIVERAAAGIYKAKLAHCSASTRSRRHIE